MTINDLSGQVAVVTGGNGGIGLGFAVGCARAGAELVYANFDAEMMRRLRDALED